MSTVTTARHLAKMAHHGQTDLAGFPYMEHIERVYDRVAFCDENVQMVALLHDIVEDTEVTLDDLRALKFNETVIAGVDAITHRPNEPLESYWTRVANNREAYIVKLHGDMPDNNDPNRHGGNDRIRTKYAGAIDFFWKHQQQVQWSLSAGHPNTKHYPY